MKRQTRLLGASYVTVAVALFLVSGALATPASAQTPGQQTTSEWAMGVRGGVAAGPNQLVVGIQFESPGLGSTGHLMFRPNVEVGVLNSIVVLEGNLDILYWATIPRSQWSLFFGAGPSVVFTHVTGGHQTGGGAAAIVGMEHNGLSIELRAGTRTHSLEAIVGYTLGRH